MAKAIIINIEKDGSDRYHVFYQSGRERVYDSICDLPQTACTWLAENKREYHDADGNEVPEDEAEAIKQDMVRSFLEYVTGETMDPDPEPEPEPVPDLEKALPVPVAVIDPPARRPRFSPQLPAVAPPMICTPEPVAAEIFHISWIIPVIPYLIGLGFVDALLYLVTICSVMAEIVEATAPIIKQLIRLLGGRAARVSRFTWSWWKEAVAFRAELIQEWKEPEYI